MHHGSRLLPAPFSGDRIQDVVFVASYAGWLLFEMFTSRTRKSSDRSAAGRDRGSFAVVVSLIWLGIGVDYACALVFPRAAIVQMRAQFFFVGIALMWAGFAFRHYTMRVLGKFFTFDVAVQAGQTAIEAGPYRYIRHPSYAGAMLTLTGIGLALGNWVGLLMLLAITSIGYGYRIHVEEAALIAAIGEPYKSYIRRTRRLVPFLL
jgi:protein-S-isoprenylcysteine O-methyltransferase Ste14